LGGAWGPSTIHGNRDRGTGILNNELYIGRLIWNRLRYLKDPETGKRVSRLNPENEWILQEVPELRIIEPDLWEAAKARQANNNVVAKDTWRRCPSSEQSQAPSLPLHCDDTLRLLWRWFFNDLESSARLFDCAQQGHMRQSHDDPAGRARKVRA
jgi:hypothetical protein